MGPQSHWVPDRHQKTGTDSPRLLQGKPLPENRGDESKLLVDDDGSAHPRLDMQSGITLGVNPGSLAGSARPESGQK